MIVNAIEVEGLGKEFRIAPTGTRHNTLRDRIAASLRPPRWLTPSGPPDRRDTREEHSFWALRDVTFEVARGDVVGIIGRNGAGKSTLLKILSRITEPTVGEARVRGRVGSLLEVGTGFHSELSGRENIYLSGAINGMTRREIAGKFDDMVSFAEVERFIDLPVKHYSSGMYLRLAFAVAAHLEPEVLIVDEVLAVGDVEFQKKCLGQMESVSGAGGRTVLFVSHNMNAIQRLCSRCIHLRQGHVVEQGTTQGVVARYLAETARLSMPSDWIDLSGLPRTGSGEARFRSARYTSHEPATAFHPYPFAPVEIELRIDSDRAMEVGSLAVTFYDRGGTKLVNLDSRSIGRSIPLAVGENRVRVTIEQLYLNPGVYTVGLWLAQAAGTPIDHAEAALEVEVVEHESMGFGSRPPGDGAVPGRFEIAMTGGAA